MIDTLKTLAQSHGDKLAIVSMDSIRALQADLAKFRNDRDAQLGDYQKWIFDEIHRFDSSAHMRSVIIVAVSRPLYARVTWHVDDKQYKAFSGAAADADKASNYITTAVQAAGYKINKETRLPLKNLAVQSGLAQYGRNNIVYVDSMGSAAALLAFSTDIPCDDATWREPVFSPTCDDCDICLNLCPTNAIVADKPLIDSHNCLTRLSQMDDDFPDWVSPTAHHSTYYCLLCQARCPMNKGQKVIDISFDQAETARILAGRPYDDVPDGLASKIALLTGLGKLDTVPRNLRVLFDVMDKGHVPKL